MSLLVILVILTTPFPANSHRRGWRTERAIEGLYLNKTNGCDEYVSRSQRSVCAHHSNFTKILRSATSRAVAFCKKIFKYEHWPCRIDETIFTKAEKVMVPKEIKVRFARNGLGSRMSWAVGCSRMKCLPPEQLPAELQRNISPQVGRERAFLTGLLAWSVSQAVAHFCARGKLFECSHWQTPFCSDAVNLGSAIATDYFLSDGIGLDIIGKMVKHNIKNGIQESRTTECIIFKSLYEFKISLSWPPVLKNKNIAETFLSKYHSAIKWETNSANFNEAKKRKKQLIYLNDSEDYCELTRNRRCRDRDNCSYLCCGRGFYKHKLVRRREIDCGSFYSFFATHNKCIKYKVTYICR